MVVVVKHKTKKTVDVQFSKRNLNSYVKLLRINHWPKNVVVLLGVVLSTSIAQPLILSRSILAFFLACFISSANYIVNEITDSEFDAQHPTKKNRPLASGSASVKYAKLMMVVLLTLTLITSLLFLEPLVTTFLLTLFLAGILYNVPPLRFKDKPILDVITESINNPIRFLIGWNIVASSGWPSLYLLGLLWTSGMFLMTYKRYREMMLIPKEIAVKYRKSFVFYTPDKLALMCFFLVTLSLLLFKLII